MNLNLVTFFYVNGLYALEISTRTSYMMTNVIKANSILDQVLESDLMGQKHFISISFIDTTRPEFSVPVPTFRSSFFFGPKILVFVPTNND